MSERFLEKLDRLGAEAGIETMTPAIRRFALLVRNDVVSGWPSSKPLSGYINAAGINANDSPHIVVEKLERVIEAKLKEKNNE